MSLNPCDLLWRTRCLLNQDLASEVLAGTWCHFLFPGRRMETLIPDVVESVQSRPSMPKKGPKGPFRVPHFLFVRYNMEQRS